MLALRLRTYLAVLLVVTTLATLGVVGVAVLAVRLPQIEREDAAAIQRAADELGARVELLLGRLEGRLALLGDVLDLLPDARLRELLDASTEADGPFDAVYVLAEDGRVDAVGLGGDLRELRHELVGSDLGGSTLWRETRARGTVTWSGKHLSALSGQMAVGLAVPISGGMLICYRRRDYVADRPV